MNTPQQIEFFRPDDAVGLRKRTLLSRAEFSQAVRSGRLRAVTQDPHRGGGYHTQTLNALSAESQNRIAAASTSKLSATATVFARRDGRDVPDAKDADAARLWLNSTPERRVSMASGFKTVNGWGCRMNSSGRTSFYKLS